MPQLPNSSTEDYGADDEVKEYKQEDGEETENGAPVDLVNDIKSDLIKREADNSEEVPKPSSDTSSAPIAQLLSFPDRYNEHLNSNTRTGYHQSGDGMRKHAMHRGHGSTSGIFHPAHQGYTPGQYQYHVYPGVKPERYHYDPSLWPPRGAVLGQPSSQYSANYPNPATATSANIPRLSHPNMTADPRAPLRCAPPPPPNQTVMNRGPTVCMGGSSLPSQNLHMPSAAPGMENVVSGRDGQKAKLSHVKKPLNAFMLYMKDMRSKVVSECTLKESAAINQILGKRWHALDRGEQAKYYEMARKERQLHMQLYPGWSARDNYAQQGKKKKRKRDKSQEITNPKKCRARYGLDRQHEWCKPCRRKKKCIRFVAGNNGQDSSAASGLAAAEIENIDTNTSGNMSTISTNSPGSPG